MLLMIKKKRDYETLLGKFGKNEALNEVLVIQLYLTLWPPRLVCQAPPSMEFSRQEYWNGFPFSSIEDLLYPGTELGSATLQADSLLSESPGKRGIIIGAQPRSMPLIYSDN